MSELFDETEDEVTEVEVVEEFDKVDLDGDIELLDLEEVVATGLDARRRLEHMLDEKRLKSELDDFIDY